MNRAALTAALTELDRDPESLVELLRSAAPRACGLIAEAAWDAGHNEACLSDPLDLPLLNPHTVERERRLAKSVDVFGIGRLVRDGERLDALVINGYGVDPVALDALLRQLGRLLAPPRARIGREAIEETRLIVRDDDGVSQGDILIESSYHDTVVSPSPRGSAATIVLLAPR